VEATPNGNVSLDPSPTASAPQPGVKVPDTTGGGRMSRRGYYLGLAVIMIAAFVGVLGLSWNHAREVAAARSEGSTGKEATPADWPRSEDPAMPRPPAKTIASASIATRPAAQPLGMQQQQPMMRRPSALTEWRERSYLSALQAPILMDALHTGSTLELARAEAQPTQGEASIQTSSGAAGATAQAAYHSPAPPYTVMAGTVIPAVLVTGINSGAPAQVLAQVAANVYDSATGRYLLIPQGSRIVGDYATSTQYGQDRIAVNWRRLIFPNTASLDLPSMPATDAQGYGGMADQVNNHYLKSFGAAAVVSLIGAGQMVGQMGLYGGSTGFSPYGGYGYGMSPLAMASEMGGAAASAQMGGVAQQSLQRGMNIPPTIEIRPGYLFNVEITTDLTLPGPYQQ
jgi:type IV secretory pathway VirB10-like protein